MRTKQEIEAEIKALKALKPVGDFRRKTAATIETAIEELEFGVDQTAEEWNELSDEQRDIVNVAAAWRSGEETKPSEGWGGLVS
jgi:hypothetical protein